MQPQAPAPSPQTPPLIVSPMPFYAAITLLSAFLLFLVQPLIAKAILPWFGGAPAVWTTCLLFFQTALLAGYAYAHLTRRLVPRRQVALHVVLLLATIAALPILPATSWKPSGGESPAWRILGLLAATVGAPYLMLATTAPLLQDWFSREAGGAPYRLYAWSNAGSLIALLGYPFVFERVLSVPQQAWVWSAVYAVFVAGCALLSFRVMRLVRVAAPVADLSAGDLPAEPRSGDRLLWFAFAACGSALLMTMTNQLSLDVAAIPFLWVLPLALYLLTFILSFAGYYRRLVWRPAFIIGLGVMAALYKLGAGAELVYQIAGSSFTLFAGCMICHGELVQLSPRPRHLTVFYLTMSAGGAAGGIAVGLLAPLVFRDFWELPIFLLLPYVLMAVVTMRGKPGNRRPVTWIAVAGILWLGVAAFLLPALRGTEHRVESARNFYGVLHVLDERVDSIRVLRNLRHGRITHGTQFIAGEDRSTATAYYSKGSGVELAIDHHPSREAGKGLQIGAIGLGVGTIATYGVPGDTLRFFEINPEVIRLARTHFTFLADSKSKVRVVLGDGRLSLEHEVAAGTHPQRYDVLVVDAFSGDAIPVHLLTLEAMQLYSTALKDDGILAIHTSNRYLNLARVVSGLAPMVRKQVVRIRTSATVEGLASTWLLVTNNRPFLRWVANNVPNGADIPAEPAVVWTDAFSNLYEVLGSDVP